MRTFNTMMISHQSSSHEFICFTNEMFLPQQHRKVVVFHPIRFFKGSTHNVTGLGSLKENAGRLLQSANFRQLDAVNFGTSHQGDINCSSLPAGLAGNGEFERKFEKISGEIYIQNEVSLGGSPTIYVTLQATLIGALDIKRIDLLIGVLSSDLPYLVPKRITINILAIFLPCL